MKDLNYQLSEMCRDNRDGSFSTQATRSRILDLIASQLLEIGFRRMQPRSLKPKHVNALVAHWQEQGIGVGTLKNRLSALRWWAKKVNKPSIIARDNSAYGIGRRAYIAEVSKAQELNEKKLSLLSDKYVRLSIRLQAACGLRREEAIKFSPNYAVQDDHIKLKPSWTKGGRARTVPITNEDQRRFVGQGRCTNTAPPELCEAATPLRETYCKSRAVSASRIATRLCSAALFRAQRTGLSSGGWVAIEGS